MRNAPSEIPRTRKITPPAAPNAASTRPAASDARKAVRRLCSRVSDSVIDRNSGTAAGASTTSSRVVSVENVKDRTAVSTGAIMSRGGGP